MITMTSQSHEMAILRRVVEPNEPPFTPEAAKAILRLDFDPSDRKRMNVLAAKNRSGKLTEAEDEELTGYIRVGQMLGILRSTARRSLAASRTRRKS